MYRIHILLQKERVASDIGGILGLWLGFSVLTIFEFIELAIDFVVLGMIKLRGHQAKAGSKMNGEEAEEKKGYGPDLDTMYTPASSWSPTPRPALPRPTTQRTSRTPEESVEETPTPGSPPMPRPVNPLSKILL